MPYLFLVILLFFLNPVFADPFYPEQPAHHPKSSELNFAKSLAFSPPCLAEKKLENIYLPIDFTQLKLIGIVKNQNIFKALFLDKENKLIDLKEDDFIPSAQIQIEKIDLKQITIIDWQQTSSCHEPYRIQLKL